MTYQNIQTTPQQPSALPQYQPVTGAAQSVFQPGFAGTNVQEVRALNAGYPASAAFGPYSGQAYAAQQQQQPTAYGTTQALGGSASAIFQPGFAGTNAQEVRQDYALSQQSTIPAYGNPYQTGAIGAPVSAAPVSAIFQPGFAGTNVQQVRQEYAPSQQGAIPHPAYAAPTATGMTAGSIFQPGFAGTNVQEVRALNAGYPVPAAFGPYSGQAYATQQQPTAAQQQPTGSGTSQALGGSASAIFQPGFAGTNVQEVRQDYTLSQQSAQPPYGYAAPGRPV